MRFADSTLTDFRCKSLSLQHLLHLYFLSLTSISSSAGVLLPPQPQSDMSHHEDEEDTMASEVSVDRNDWHDAGSNRRTTENGEEKGFCIWLDYQIDYIL